MRGCSDGRHFPQAVQHILGTLDPRIPGLGAWQPAETSNAGYADVIDLSALPWEGVPAGTLATVAAGEPGTGGAAGYGNTAVTPATWTYFPQVFLEGTAIVLDPSGPLYALIGGTNLRAWQDGTDVTGHGHWACLGN